MVIIIRGVRAPLADTDAAALAEAERRLQRYKIKHGGLSLCKKSVDARKKSDIHYICSVSAVIQSAPGEKTLRALDAAILEEERLYTLFGHEKLTVPPVIVGFGPCGMFASLLLAENGYRPIVIERGGCVAERKAAVERFYKTGVLDTSTNIQFGAGGAGTFSDGKLLTRINSPKCAYVLSRLREFGAPDDISVNAKPHIGTDLLEIIVQNIADRITSLGGKILYNTKLESINTDRSGRALSVNTSAGEIACGPLVLALGHSARDTYGYLIKNSYEIIPKAFSVGVRIEHLQSDINRALYGESADLLPPAEYTLSHREGERGVYSFCMCPGGEVVAATSEEEAVVTNGMSRRSRDGKNANSAIAVSVLPSDYGQSAEGAIAFQRRLERTAFTAGGGDYYAPVQTVCDFLSEKSGSEPTKVEPSYMGGKVRLAGLQDILPPFVCDMLRTGISRFGRQIEGFDAPHAILTGLETRTSAPLRIMRGEDMTALGHPDIYPCGEGAGYAGGITSAAVDGINCALKIMEKYGKKEY